MYTNHISLPHKLQIRDKEVSMNKNAIVALKPEVKLLINPNTDLQENLEEYIDPINILENKFFFSGYNSKVVPFFSSRVAAGTPSFGDDSIEDLIDLHDHLVANPPSTYLMRAVGNSMINAGILPRRFAGG